MEVPMISCSMRASSRQRVLRFSSGEARMTLRGVVRQKCRVLMKVRRLLSRMDEDDRRLVCTWPKDGATRSRRPQREVEVARDGFMTRNVGIALLVLVSAVVALLI